MGFVPVPTKEVSQQVKNTLLGSETVLIGVRSVLMGWISSDALAIGAETAL